MYNNTGNNYAYLGMQLPISGANIDGTGLMLMERIKFTGRTTVTTISTANSNLDGTGTVSDLITGSGSGTLIKRIFIKAQGSTTQGMIRIFFKVSTSNWLLREVYVPAVTPDARHESFMAVIDEPFFLKASYILRASTQNAETFCITVEGLDMAYPA